jgi:hypothetical protein
VDASWLAPVEAGRRLDVTSARVKQLIDAGRLEWKATPLGRLISAASVAQLAHERQARGGRRGG